MHGNYNITSGYRLVWSASRPGASACHPQDWVCHRGFGSKAVKQVSQGAVCIEAKGHWGKRIAGGISVIGKHADAWRRARKRSLRTTKRSTVQCEWKLLWRRYVRKITIRVTDGCQGRSVSKEGARTSERVAQGSYLRARTRSARCALSAQRHSHQASTDSARTSGASTAAGTSCPARAASSSAASARMQAFSRCGCGSGSGC